MSGQVVSFPQRGEVILTKAQLAAHFGRSSRWVEIKVREGMPVLEATDRWGRRRYNLRECEEWLKAGKPKGSKRADRMTELERQVADLAAQVADLRRAG